MKRSFVIVYFLLSSLLGVSAQNWGEAFSHLDLSLSAGSTGVGFDLSTPVTKWLDMRAGGIFMPHVNVDAHFNVQAGRIENGEFVSMGSFGSLASYFQKFTGFEVRDNVTVNGHPTARNFTLMFDVKPIKDWHVTLGFQWGDSQFAEGINCMQDAVTLLGVGVYNNLYDKLSGIELPSSLTGEIYDRMIESRDSWGDKPWLTLGDVALNVDPMMTDEEVREYSNKVVTALVAGMFEGEMTTEKIDWVLNGIDQIMQSGHAGVYVGDYKRSTYQRDAQGQILTDGNGNPLYQRDAAGNEMRQGYPYIMIPAEDGTARVSIRTNRFKPYLGFGYGKELGGKYMPGFKVSFDAGILFWGGTPKVQVHDGTDLAHDLLNVQGRVGDYVRTISAFKVYPVLCLRLTKRLF